MNKSYIRSVGSYLPERVITNHELSKTIDTTHEWIVQRTGIEQRHVAQENELTSDLAFKSAIKALKNSNLSEQDIDLIIVATTTPDLTFPSTAVRVQRMLGIENNCPAFDLQAVCSGFVYGLEVANNFIGSSKYKNILLIGAEKMSSILDWNDRSTAVLFGDGAGAAIISAKTENDEGEIFSSVIASDGRCEDMLKTTGGVSFNAQSGFITMNGREVYKHAVTKLTEVSKQVLEQNNFTSQNVDLVVPHQANIRIINSVIEKLAIDQEKVIKTVSKHANTSAASIPLALSHAFDNGTLKRGQLVLVESFGAGMSWGGGLFRF